MDTLRFRADTSARVPNAHPENLSDPQKNPADFKDELCALLGPLVTPLLQDANGALDLSKLPTKNFADFRAFLITQVRVDGIAFNEHWLDSYHALLSDPKYDALLTALFDAARAQDSDFGPGNGAPLPNSRGLRDPSPLPRKEDGILVRPRDSDFLSGALHTFTAALIKVSADKFTAHHLRSQAGRDRLTKILLDPEHYSHDLRSDLVKAIAVAGRNFGTSRELYRRLNQEIAVWNYANTSVTKEELDRATNLAREILQEVGKYQDTGQELLPRYLKRPQDVTRFSGLEKELSRTLTNEAISDKATFIQFNQGNHDPKVALGVKLDELWLLLVDESRWREAGSLKIAKHVAFVLKEVEGYRQKLNQAKSTEDFMRVAEGVRTLLKGGLGVKGEGTWRSIKDFTSGNTVADLFQGLPEVHKSPYDNLLQFVEELHYAREMGETLRIGDLTPAPEWKRVPTQEGPLSSGPAPGSGAPEVIPAQFLSGDANTDGVPSLPSPQEAEAKAKAEEAKRFTEAKTQFIHGLNQTKRSLWYQYKQHKALSRGLSQAAQLVGKGDISEIKKGQAALDQLVQQVEQAQDPEALKEIVQNLQETLKEDGPLHQAMVAAEMDGTEQLIGLGQTILIILVTKQLGQGMARLSAALAETSAGQRIANIATQLQEYRLGQTISQGIQSNAFAWRVSKGFALGAWITTAENGIAAVTDEVKPEGHHLGAWAKDALATGIAMGVFTPGLSYLGENVEKNLIKRMMGRYFGSTKAPLHFLADAAAEAGEEVFDATIRGKLDDADAALSFDQFREITLVSGLGGFTKMGLVAEMLKSQRQDSDSGSGSATSKPRSKVLGKPRSWPKNPIRDLFHSQDLLSQLLLVSMVGGGMGPAKRSGKSDSILKRLMDPTLSDKKRHNLLSKYFKRVRSAGEGAPILSQAVTDMPQLFNHSDADISHRARSIYLLALGNLKKGNPKIPMAIDALDRWSLDSKITAEHRLEASYRRELLLGKLPEGDSRLVREIARVREKFFQRGSKTSEISKHLERLQHFLEPASLDQDELDALETDLKNLSKTWNHDAPLHRQIELLRLLALHQNLHKGNVKNDVPLASNHPAFLLALQRFLDLRHSFDLDPFVVAKEIQQTLSSLNEIQKATVTHLLRAELQGRPSAPMTLPQNLEQRLAMMEELLHEFKTDSVPEKNYSIMGLGLGLQSLFRTAGIPGMDSLSLGDWSIPILLTLGIGGGLWAYRYLKMQGENTAIQDWDQLQTYLAGHPGHDDAVLRTLKTFAEHHPEGVEEIYLRYYDNQKNKWGKKYKKLLREISPEHLRMRSQIDPAAMQALIILSANQNSAAREALTIHKEERIEWTHFTPFITAWSDFLRSKGDWTSIDLGVSTRDQHNRPLKIFLDDFQDRIQPMGAKPYRVIRVEIETNTYEQNPTVLVDLVSEKDGSKKSEIRFSRKIRVNLSEALRLNLVMPSLIYSHSIPIGEGRSYWILEQGLSEPSPDSLGPWTMGVNAMAAPMVAAHLISPTDTHSSLPWMALGTLGILAMHLVYRNQSTTGYLSEIIHDLLLEEMDLPKMEPAILELNALATIVEGNAGFDQMEAYERIHRNLRLLAHRVERLKGLDKRNDYEEVIESPWTTALILTAAVFRKRVLSRIPLEEVKEYLRRFQESPQKDPDLFEFIVALYSCHTDPNVLSEISWQLNLSESAINHAFDVQKLMEGFYEEFYLKEIAQRLPRPIGWSWGPILGGLAGLGMLFHSSAAQAASHTSDASGIPWHWLGGMIGVGSLVAMAMNRRPRHTPNLQDAVAEELSWETKLTLDQLKKSLPQGIKALSQVPLPERRKQEILHHILVAAEVKTEDVMGPLNRTVEALFAINLSEAEVGRFLDRLFQEEPQTSLQILKTLPGKALFLSHWYVQKDSQAPAYEKGEIFEWILETGGPALPEFLTEIHRVDKFFQENRVHPLDRLGMALHLLAKFRRFEGDWDRALTYNKP